MSRSLALLIACALLQGCANLPVGSDGLSQEERRLRLEAVDRWQVRGRLAVDTGQRAFQGSFNWLQEQEALTLSIRGPLGGGVLQISGTPEMLTLRARGESRVLTDPETELSELVGWWLPVASLSAWLRGLEDETFPAQTQVAADGTLESLEQRLWRLDFVGYQVASGLLVPRRIDLEHGDLKLRATIDSFMPMSSPASALN
jgi:outer membrane lipoprotein LolB